MAHERATPDDTALRGTPPRTEWVRAAPSDVARLAVALSCLVVTLVIGRVFGAAVVGAIADLLAGFSSLPTWVVTVITVVGVLTSAALVVAAVAGAVLGRHWRLLLNATVAAALAAGAIWLLNPVVEVSERVAPDPAGTLFDGRVPSAALLAAAAAAVTVGGLWVSRRWRRLAWAAVAVLTVLRFVGAPVAFDALLAVLTGWTIGSLVIVVLGAPSRRPTPTTISDGLRAVGIPLVDLEPASVDARGSAPYFGVTADDTRLFVKALGTDERGADLMFRVWRSLQPRDLGDERPFSSLRRGVEHEALVALAAREMGVRTPPLLAVSTAEPNGFVLTYQAIEGRSLDGVDVARISDEVLDQIWGQLVVMRRHRIAHRDLRLANVFLSEADEVSIIDFGFAELAAAEVLLQTDVAELLASSSTIIGVDRAVAAAGRALPRDQITAAAGRLQPARLSGATRTAMKAAPGLLAELRSACE